MESFGSMDFLNKNLGGFGIHRFHDGFVLVARGDQLNQAVGDVVRKIADEGAVLTDLDFVLAGGQINRLADV